jgi:hypothetical protein
MIINQGLNWIITDHIADLTPIKKVMEGVSDEDWSRYTTAKGPQSKQNYIINPSWMPSMAHKEPEGWSDLKLWYEKTVKELLVHHGIMPSHWNGLTANRAWTVVGEEGSYHTIHDHGPNSVCSIVYLSVPEPVNDNDKAGQVYFVLQSDPYHSLTPVKHKVVHVSPKPGMLIIFPSWVLHGVYPQGPGIRQTVNVDFIGNIQPGPEDSAGFVSVL